MFRSATFISFINKLLFKPGNLKNQTSCTQPLQKTLNSSATGAENLNYLKKDSKSVYFELHINKPSSLSFIVDTFLTFISFFFPGTGSKRSTIPPHVSKSRSQKSLTEQTDSTSRRESCQIFRLLAVCFMKQGS